MIRPSSTTYGPRNVDRAISIHMKKIQEIVVKLSYFGFTRTCGEVVVSECHLISSRVNLIGCAVKCVGTASCGEFVGHPIKQNATKSGW